MAHQREGCGGAGASRLPAWNCLRPLLRNWSKTLELRRGNGTAGTAPIPRGALLFREDFLVHGLTPGCSGCRCIRKGAKICGHSERCRKRMEALVAQGPAGKARLEKAKRRLARYVELTGRWTRARKGDVGNFDPAIYWWFFTPSVVDESKCLARRWAKGVGLQCTRFPLPGARVCGRHCKFQTHGLVTGDVPPAKLRQFLKA